jgi:hypothetical protein
MLPHRDMMWAAVNPGMGVRVLHLWICDVSRPPFRLKRNLNKGCFPENRNAAAYRGAAWMKSSVFHPGGGDRHR